MKRLVLSGTLILLCVSALGQNSPSASQFIDARQPEVDRMAEIFDRTHLDDGSWTHHQVSQCAEFTHHAFVQFDRVAGKDAPAHFLAIYDLDHAPAHSLERPWEGGILYAPLHLREEISEDTGPASKSLVALVNRIIKQEQSKRPAWQPWLPVNAEATAECFIALSGDRLGPPRLPTESIPLEPSPLPVSALLISLAARPGYTRNQSVSSNGNGGISATSVSVQRIGP